MLSIALLIALAAFAVMAATTATWFKRIQQVAIPDNRLGFLGLWLLAALLGGGSFFAEGAGFLSGIFGILAALVGAGFLVLYALGKQGEDHPIMVGDNMPAFSAIDDSKSICDSSVFDGSPVLIKFFRGHWWPYCVAELRRWDEELGAELESRGVQIVGICTDSPGQIAKQRGKHGLSGTFLSDSDLTVTDLFGLRNTNIALRPNGLPGLPIPTTLLIDSHGKVVWKDQSPDYMQRSDPDYVRIGLNAL